MSLYSADVERNMSAADKRFAACVLQELSLTDAQRKEIQHAQQRSPLWHSARMNRLTASKFRYVTAAQQSLAAQTALLKSMLWPTVASEALTNAAAADDTACEDTTESFADACMRWGTECEPLVRELYTRWRRVSTPASGAAVEETGLVVGADTLSWLAVSPDFLVWEAADAAAAAMSPLHAHADGVRVTATECAALLDAAPAPPAAGAVSPATVAAATSAVTGSAAVSAASTTTAVGCGEIKCPVRCKTWMRDVKDQITGAMALQALPWCDVIVYTPAEGMHIRRFPFDELYWQRTLLPALERFYFLQFLPRLRLVREGVLRAGEVNPPLVCATAATVTATPDAGVCKLLALAHAKRKPTRSDVRTAAAARRATCRRDVADTTDASTIAAVLTYIFGSSSSRAPTATRRKPEPGMKDMI